MNKIKIYLDMDGVCCNWLDATLRILDKEDLIGKIPKNSYSIEEATKIDFLKIREEISKQGSLFWKNLEEFSWFTKLYSELSNLGEVIFLTAPSTDPSCLKGKLMWLQDRFGENFKSYVMTPQKYHCANSFSILIDDTLEQCHKFIKNDGFAVMFPSELNHLIDDLKTDERVLDYTIKLVKEQISIIEKL
jgi:5'(3')-deoxyribonucleotidase